MDIKKDSKNDYLVNCDDDNHDSDIESRLYAEIYFSNTIEGDNNFVDSQTDNETSHDVDIVSNNVKDINSFKFSEENMNQLKQTHNNDLHNNDKTQTNVEDNLRSIDTIHETEFSNCQMESNLNKSVNFGKNIRNQNIFIIKKSNKRLNDNNHDELLKSSNKKFKGTEKILNCVTIQTNKNRSDCSVNQPKATSINYSNSEVNTLPDQNKNSNFYMDKSEDFEKTTLNPEYINLSLNEKSRMVKKVKNKKSKNVVPKKIAIQSSKKSEFNQIGVNIKVIDSNIQHSEANKSSDYYMQENEITEISSSNLQQESVENIRQNELEDFSRNFQQSKTTENNDYNIQENEIIENSNVEFQQNEIIDNVDNNDKQHKEIEDNDRNLHQNDSTIISNDIEHYNSLEVSEIIDISSESSEDSVHFKSKYNVNMIKRKDCLRKSHDLIQDDSEDSISSDEESIFEVPIPRKPTPPLIDLQESDNESDSNSSSSESIISPINENRNKEENSLETSINTANVDCQIDYENELVSNLILNCTQIQTHVSNLSDIQRLSQLSNVRKFVKATDTNEQNLRMEAESSNIDSCTSTSLINRKDIDDHSNKEKVSTSAKNTSNSLQKKQKTTVYLGNKNISMEEYFFQPMTNKMKSFYNKSWGGENFDIDKLKSKMSSDPNNWAVLADDTLINYSHEKRYFGRVCNRCQQPGHRVIECSEPFKKRVCHMCGGRGHFDTGCRNKICLTCGRKRGAYQQTCEDCRTMFCSRCNSQGHISNSCPDLWRRYHQTINTDTVIAPKNFTSIMKPQHELYCCNCAKKGHDSINCKRRTWNQHFPNPPYVSNYNGPSYLSEQFNLPETSISMHSNIAASRDIINSSEVIDFTSDDFENPNTMCNNFFHFDNNDQNTNVHGARISASNNPIESNEKLSFSIISQNFKNDFTTINSQCLKFPIANTITAHTSKNFGILLEFLNLLQAGTPIYFSINEVNNCIIIDLKCLHDISLLLKDIISQYVRRNYFERCYMYLELNRDANFILNHLNLKINEMNNIKDCAVQLYEEGIRLNETIYKNKKCENDSRQLLLHNRLSICQQKLLMILCREGIISKPLKELLKIKNYFKFVQRKQTTTCNKDGKQGVNLISFNSLLKYLYNYNNVFVPYTPKNLFKLMQQYKGRIKLYNRIANHSFPLNKSVDKSFQNPKEQEIIKQLASQIQSQLQSKNIVTMPLLSVTNTVDSLSVNNTALPTVSVQTEHQQISENRNIKKSTKKNIKKNIRKNLKKNFVKIKQNTDPNLLKKEGTILKGQKKKLFGEYKMFINQTKQLLHNAYKINAPRLNDKISIIKKKMNDSTINAKDVETFRQIIKSFKKKKSKKPKENT